jgi:hypothetical protein
LASPRKSAALQPGVAHSRRAAMLMLTGLIAAGTPLPYTAVAVIPLVWAGVESVRSIQARSTAHAQALAQSAARSPTRGIVSSVVGLVLVSVLTLMVLVPYAFYGTFKGRQDCDLGANTAIAAADCKARFSSGLDPIFGGFLSSE